MTGELERVIREAALTLERTSQELERTSQLVESLRVSLAPYLPAKSNLVEWPGKKA
jgi:hypothetical protein